MEPGGAPGVHLCAAAFRPPFICRFPVEFNPHSNSMHGIHGTDDKEGERMNADQSTLRAKQIKWAMKKAQQWNGVLPVNVYSGAPIPFLNVAK